MPTWVNTDTRKPTFPKERQLRPVTTLVANANTNFLAVTNTALYFANTSSITVGMYVSGNNIVVSSLKPGFLTGNVTVTAVNGANVIISNAVSANVNMGDSFTFSKLISYNKPKDIAYSANTVLVNSGRLANAVFGINTTANVNNSVAHAGWINIQRGHGFVANLSVSNANSTLTYTNTYLTFVPGRFPNAVNANAQIIVIGTSNVTVQLNGGGTGYIQIPTVNAGNSTNNSGLIFTVTPGGRMGRITTECLVALSNAQPQTANSGGYYFPGP